jgi:hypothetical protein
VLDEPLHPAEVKRLVATIIGGAGTVRTSRHAQQEAMKDGMSSLDTINILRGGAVDPGEFENGAWRYRIRTQRMVAVVQLLSESELRVITVWRIRS